MIAIVSHDAGGAEVLASYVAQQSLSCYFVLDGPAVSVFERRLGRVVSLPLEEAITKCDWLLCSTSWQSDLEWKAIGIARRNGKRVVAFLDHWVNYRARFVRKGVEQLPDEIWVGDSMAETLAKNFFSGLPVILVPNPYFEDLKRDITTLKKSRQQALLPGNAINVLFVCEPLSEHGLRQFGNERHWGYTEYDALRYFFQNLKVLGEPVNRVVVRPHPSEPVGKYDWVSGEFGPDVVVGGYKPLLEEIAESDVVVGCESMAMVVGLVAGRRVISCIPPEGKACALPHSEIESMRDFLKLNILNK
jgi:hypothetical protein